MEMFNNRCTGNCASCGKCKGANILDEMNNRKTKLSFMPDDFIADEMEDYGISFDIGTTTVVGNLWNLKKGISLQIIAKTNPQTIFGSDVISRINYCEDEPIKFVEIRDKIIGCLNEIIRELLSSNQIDRQDIVKITVVGNTTMSHIFAGFNPSPLARAPFTPAFVGERVFKAYELPLHVNPEATVILLSNIAGHVGSDITGGLLATRFEKLDGLNLFIDIGTNGEIVLTKDNKTYASSTAAGPAFEGAAIYQGMRASSGAIESVQIKDGTVFFKTIDDTEPIGICGSGLIEAISEMLKNKIINKTGRLLFPEEIEGKPLKDDLSLRLRVGPKGREFVLVFKEDKQDIVITQMDIREVQLAKGAIYAGMKLMLAELNEEVEDIDRVIVAGAFGTYIDKESGVNIGIFPNISLDKITFVGNAAGTGSNLVLLSGEERIRANELAHNIEHLELAACKNFQEEYLSAMSF